MADAKLLGTIYKILSWSSLAGLILTIVLVLHKSPAPNIPFDPGAAERAEQKFAAADQAKAAGQPGSVALDRSELNSYLAQNLQTQTRLLLRLLPARKPGCRVERRCACNSGGGRLAGMRRMILARLWRLGIRGRWRMCSLR